MHKLSSVILAVILLSAFQTNAQSAYDSTGVEGDYLKGWTLVKKAGKPVGPW